MKRRKTHMGQSQLLAHCGSSKITREELKVIPTPAGSATHQPLPHFEIVGALVETLSFRQISVVREEYAVTGDGMKLFGVLDLETTFDGCRFSIGVRNSNDKSMRLALTVGYRVLVCDNMAFHGDFTPVLAKHTKHLDLVDILSPFCGLRFLRCLQFFALPNFLSNVSFVHGPNGAADRCPTPTGGVVSVEVCWTAIFLCSHFENTLLSLG